MKKGLFKPAVWFVVLFGLFLISPVQSEQKSNPKKVKVCHKGTTLEIAEEALSAHLEHGDTLGPCEITPSKN